MMYYSIKTILSDKKARKALAEHPFTFEDENGVFRLDFRNDSMRINHRRTFDVLYELGGDQLMERILNGGNTCLSDSNGKGMSTVKGTDRYFLKTNAGAPTVLSSILHGISAWAELAEEKEIEFDPDLIYCKLTDEEYDEIFFPLKDEPDPLHDVPAADEEETDETSPYLIGINGSVILKEDLYAIYDNDAGAIVCLPFTDGTPGKLEHIAVCELVDSQRPELGWKYKALAEDKKWGWLHPEFQQVFSPRFDKFACLNEEDDADLLAFETGDGTHSVYAVWTFRTGLFPLMEQLPMHATAHDRIPDCHLLIAADMTVFRFLRQKQRVDGKEIECILITSGYSTEVSIYYHEYWEVHANGSTERAQFTRVNDFLIHSGAHRNYGFTEYPSFDFCRYMIHHSDFCSSGIAHLEEKNGTRFSFHKVWHRNEPNAFALGLETCNGADSHMEVLTPFVFTSFSLVRTNRNENGTEYYVSGDTLGRSGLIRIECDFEKNSAKTGYPIPFEYNSISVNEDRVVVWKDHLVGELNLYGNWTTPLHDRNAPKTDDQERTVPPVPNAHNFKDYFSDCGGEGRHSQVRNGKLEVQLRFNDEYMADTNPLNFLYGDFDIVYSPSHGGKPVENLKRLKAYALTDNGIIYASGNAIWYMTEGGTVLLGLQENVLSLSVRYNTLTVEYANEYHLTRSNEHRDECGYMYEAWYDVYSVDVKKRTISF